METCAPRPTPTAISPVFRQFVRALQGRTGRRRPQTGGHPNAPTRPCAVKPPASPATTPEDTPIVFVHGNGDSGALWHTTLWRFESNGWRRDRLHAIDMPCPMARDDDTVPQPNRSSSTEHMRHLAAEVEAVLQATGASKVILVANSRGGYAVRNYIAHGGGAAKVSHAVLGGTPNHGVWARADIRPGSEFNGAGPFLTGLNLALPDGSEVPPGVAWMTLRSDGNDKHAQPFGDLIGAPGVPTNVGPDGPALRGALDVVLPGADHRETSFGPEAFVHTYRFLTGRDPATPAIVPETRVQLDGKVFGRGTGNLDGNDVSNQPLVGAMVEVHAVRADTGERIGPALHRRTVGHDGRWGPVETHPGQCLEFVVAAKGYATTHLYRSPFARSSHLVHLQAERPVADLRGAHSVVALARPRGYFDLARDRISLDGLAPPDGIPPGVACVSVVQAGIMDSTERTVAGEFNGERILGRTWPAAHGHVVLLELHT
jgi:triacylglycerol lipase